MAVTKLEIKQRTALAGGLAFGEVGEYERLDGRVQFAVDPGHANNEIITDIKLSPTAPDGRVTFSADFCILRPKDASKGNHRLLLDVLNRGRKRALKYFNSSPEVSDPTLPLDPGNGFLMRHGYTVVWCGWQHDVPAVVDGLMTIDLPDATQEGQPLSGPIVVAFQPGSPIKVQALSDRMHRPYPSNNTDDPEAVLRVRHDEHSAWNIVPRSQWSFAKLDGGKVVPDSNHIYMEPGFEPGKFYQVLYSTTGAPVVGLGFLATRDLVSFLKYHTGPENPCSGDLAHAYAFGASQSGRFLRQFLYLGLNEDEADRTVFDGLIPHIAGSRRGEFNQRYGQPSSTSNQSLGTQFPFTDTAQSDPDTGRSDSLLAKLSSKGKVPKIFLTNTSAEYWRGDASLIHHDVTAKSDVEPSESVRIYQYSGTQHASATFPLNDSNPQDGSRGQQQFNAVEYAPLLRAALVHLDKWVTSDEEPPSTCHPRIDDGTAVRSESIGATYRAIPGVGFPVGLPYISRLDFGPDQANGIANPLPAVVGQAYPALVPAVDGDGNELGGIRLPDICVPLATHTGWNLRHPQMGAPDHIIGLMGSTIPFPTTKAQREAAGDPRKSIEERYESKDHYLTLVKSAIEQLIEQRYLLREDLESMLQQASLHYDTFSKAAEVPVSADD